MRPQEATGGHRRPEETPISGMPLTIWEGGRRALHGGPESVTGGPESVTVFFLTSARGPGSVTRGPGERYI
jgi:hypothetical protein